MSPHIRHLGPQRRQAGFTLVELLVAVTIGMALTLAITLMLTRFESGRRSLTNVNDSSQGGAYATYTLDRLLRNAGSGFVQGTPRPFGCRLNVARAGVTVLPRTTAFDAPFSTIPLNPRLAPVIVHAGAGTGGSDVIMVATGVSGMGEAPMPVLVNSATTAQISVPATTGARGNDLVLVYDKNDDCMIQQLATPFAGGASQVLAFAGTYASPTAGTATLSTFYSGGSADPAYVALLGNAASTNRPQFQLIGIGPNATLVAHDLLQLDGADNVVAVADGIADLRVRYGIAAVNSNVVTDWVNPATAPWDAATLQAGPGAADALRRIVALRVALLVRSNVPERDDVSPTSLTLFADLPSPVTRAIPAAERSLRWRVIEFTVPLRNVMLSPGT